MNPTVIIILILEIIIVLIFSWSLMITVIGCRKKNSLEIPIKYPGKNFRFAILICAHNEERVIESLLESLKAQTYPAEFWKVFLIADHCTDTTSSIAGTYDFVTVLDRAEGDGGKGNALHWGIEQVRTRAGEIVEVMLILDADNRVIPEFLELFNGRFCQGSQLITGSRAALNPFHSLISKWYTVYWSVVSQLYNGSHRSLGLSALVSGTGFAFSAALLEEEGFRTFTMTEDIEFSIQQNLKGICADYLEEAIFFDEQPVSLGVMVRQLRRWTTGDYQLVRRYAGKLIKQLFQKPSLQMLDSLFSLLLCGSLGAMLLTRMAMGLSGLLYGGAWAVWTLLIGLAMNGTLWISGIVAVKKSALPLEKMWSGIISYPIFIMLFSCIALYSLICPEKKWRKIEHYGIYEEKKDE